jgi:hypothetical protein
VGYAAIVLPANSVGTKQLKPSAVVSAKVKDNALTGADINEATLNPTILQKRVTGTCTGQALQSINQDGTVGCGGVGTVLPEGCTDGQVAKHTASGWVCANDIDTDTNSGGDITGVGTGAGSGLVGGASSGEVPLSLLNTCATGQVLKWNGTAWACSNDVDTDTNSGGDITDVIAGNGLTGGGSSGSATVDVAAGTGVTVSANAVGLDTTFTDARYLSTANVYVYCPVNYSTSFGGMCWQNPDQGGETFAQAAQYCAALSPGGRLPGYGELLAFGKAKAALVDITFDWAGDSTANDEAVYIDSSDEASDNRDGTRAMSTTNGYARCVTYPRVAGLSGP